MKKLLRCLGVVGFACTILLLPSYSFAEVDSNESEKRKQWREYIMGLFDGMMGNASEIKNHDAEKEMKELLSESNSLSMRTS